MNIAIIGYGRMGCEIEQVAKEKGIIVKARIDPYNEKADFKEINAESLKDVDVCIDFTHPNSAIENARKVAKLGKNIVMATTGWYDQMDEMKNIVKNSGIGFVWASNFSIGVNTFFKIVEDAAKVINKVAEYDIYCYEIHHNKKVDSPSGTAKSIANKLLENIDRKNKLVVDKLNRRIEVDELHFASIRGGEEPGTHVVCFDSSADMIELRHTARSRKGFAVGAIMAAEWLNKKKGFFSIEDMMKELLGG